MTYQIRIFAVCLVVFFLTGSVSAQQLSFPEKEVQHLLNFVSASGCTFIRNGTDYSAAQARHHLEIKYNYARKRLISSEEFISRVASKSSMSGRKYKVRCGDTEMLSREWLLKELQIFRKTLPQGEVADDLT